MSDLKAIIRETLKDVHIETGRKDDFNEVVDSLVRAVQKAYPDDTNENILKMWIEASKSGLRIEPTLDRRKWAIFKMLFGDVDGEQKFVFVDAFNTPEEAIIQAYLVMKES